MGGAKKRWIDPKKATTFSLVYRSTEDGEEDAAPQRELVEADRVGLGRVDVEAAAAAHAAAGAAQRRYPPGHPLAWLEAEAWEPAEETSEARRRELIELGFPDDGYDYIKHMRTLGHGAASLEGLPPPTAAAGAADTAAGATSGPPATFVSPATSAPADALAAGPAVFVPANEAAPPEEDVRIVDASTLRVLQAAERDDEAAGLMGGVTAFSRARDRVHGADKRELDELAEAMAVLEREEDIGDAEGAGDLLDDFVLMATGTEGEGRFLTGAAAVESSGETEAGSSSNADSSFFGSEYATEESEDEGKSDNAPRLQQIPWHVEPASEAGTARSGKPPPRPGSIASTYWREERTDRKNLLTMIDEKFEHLALEYDEDQIGELDEQGDQIRGFANVHEFAPYLDEFLASHGRSANGHEGNVHYAVPRKPSQVGDQMEAEGFADEDAAIAVQKAHEALARAEAEEDEVAADRCERVAVAVELGYRERERWDCESVLSLRSNLDNHPGRITEPLTARRAARGSGSSSCSGATAIRLDARGIPMGVLPPRSSAAAAAAAATTAAAAARSDSGEAEDGKAEEQGVMLTAAQERRKDETAEEKRARKAAVKEAKRNARANKKELKQLWRGEAQRAAERAATAQPQGAIKLPG